MCQIEVTDGAPLAVTTHHPSIKTRVSGRIQATLSNGILTGQSRQSPVPGRRNDGNAYHNSRAFGTSDADDVPNFIESEALVFGSGEPEFKSLTLFLVRPDGSKTSPIVADVQQTIGHRVRKDDLRIVYRKDGTIRVVRASLRDFTIQSDRFLFDIPPINQSVGLSHRGAPQTVH